MKKYLPFMGAAVAALAMTWTAQAKADDMFKDVPSDHWAYSAISDLQSKKVLLGYPNGYFQGKRVLTRYEFAVALKRAIDNIPVTSGKDGAAGKDGTNGADGKDGAPGADGKPGMAPEEVAALAKLADTFKAELAQLGTDVKSINSKLDAIGKSVAALNTRLDKMVSISGEFFTGFRSDMSRYGFIDGGGAVRGANKNLFTAVSAPSDFHLIASANLAGGVKFVADLVESSYLNYASLGLNGAGAIGGKASVNGGGLQTQVYQASLVVPVSQFGSGTTLEIGRFKNSLTALTYQRPDTDPYFSLPWYDDGKYVEDGFNLKTKLGSASVQIFGGTYGNQVSSTGNVLNTVALGDSLTGTKAANESAGIHIDIPLLRAGEVGLTLLNFNATGAGFTDEKVYGATLKLKPLGRLLISAEADKSVTGADFTHADGNSNEDNNAYNVNLAYASGSIKLSGGYLYIDPRYSAPGAWLKVGSVYNPVNVQGPYASLDYKMCSRATLNIGGAYLGGARNREGFTPGCSIGKLDVGLKYNLNKTVHLTADYEGDFYNFTPSVAGIKTSAQQQFITLGAGINLAGNTVLKLGYQVIAGHDNLGLTGLTGTQTTNNANVFTTQVSVHF